MNVVPEHYTNTKLVIQQIIKTNNDMKIHAENNFYLVLIHFKIEKIILFFNKARDVKHLHESLWVHCEDKKAKLSIEHVPWLLSLN